MDDLLKLLEEESRRIVAGTESHFCDGQIRIGKQLAGVFDTDFCQHLENALIGGFLEMKTGVYEKICGNFSPVCQKMTNFAL